MGLFTKKSLTKQYCDAKAKVRKYKNKKENLSPNASERKANAIDEKLARATDQSIAIEYLLKRSAQTTTVNKKTTISTKNTFNINGKK